MTKWHELDENHITCMAPAFTSVYCFVAEDHVNMPLGEFQYCPLCGSERT